MASSDPEIKDGFSLPVWMKTKPTRKRNMVAQFNCVLSEFEPFAASPPAPEDSFFYIRYPQKDVLFGKTKQQQDLNKVFGENSKEVTAASVYNIVKEKDWSKHTKPCQEVLHGIAPINTAVNSVSSKSKPAGVDDGFKGEGAACGTSVVKVAHQMISTRAPRGFTVASPEEDAATFEAYNSRHAARRGSKSLPASPQTSPTSRRKMNSNRYFTSPFEPIEDSAHNRSWLSVALLGYKKDLTTSTSTLCEEDSLESRLQGGILTQSVENLGPAPKGKEPKSTIHEATHPIRPAKPTIRPKPSELREMNFWSPTSM